MGINYSNLLYKPKLPPTNHLGSINLILKTPAVQFPDQVLEGVVHLQLQQNLPPSQIQIQLRGTEQCMWGEQRGKHRFSFQGETQFLNSQTVVFHSQSLSAGNHSIDFRIKVPPGNYPSSLILLKRELLYYATLEVKEPISPFLPGKMVVQKAPFESCCFCSQGEMELQVSSDKEHYFSNQKCKLAVHINTEELKVDLAGLKIALVARFILTDKKGYSNEFKVPAYTWTHQGLQKGKRDDRNYELDLLYALRNPESVLPSALSPQERKMAIEVQASSTRGKNARLEYLIEVKGEFDTCMCLGKWGPTCSLGITISKHSFLLSPVLMQAQPVPLGVVPEKGYNPASIL